MRLWTTILLLFVSFAAQSQLKIEEKSKQYVIKSTSDIRGFVTENHIDYALISWCTSAWTSINSSIYGLFQQQGNWYIAKITTGIPTRKDTPFAKFAFTINQHRLNKAEVDSVLRLLNPAQAFKYKQEDFNKLPETYEYPEKNGEIVQIIQPSDGATCHLLQLSNNEIKTLSFDNPDIYLKDFYPHFEGYGILKGFVNTIRQLYTLTKDLPKE